MGQSLNAGDLASWHADWSGRRVAVLGLGDRGFSVADTLCELGARVLVVADEASDEHRELLDVLGAEFVPTAGEVAPPSAFAAFDPELVVATRRPAWLDDVGVPVWNDLALAWRVRDKTATGAPMEWICVAGEGAEEIADLAARMLRAAGVRVAPAGGAVSAIDAIRDPSGFDVLVVAVADGDLTPDLRPLAAACVVGGDRADRGLVFADARLACVYGVSDESTRALVEDAEVQEGCRAIGVGLGVPGVSELGVVEDVLVDRAFLEDRRTSALELATFDDLRAAGLTTREDILRVLTAAALARAAEVPPAAVRDGIRAWPTRL